MPRDPLDTVLRLRRRAVDEARRELVERVGLASQASADASLAEQAIHDEIERASDPAGDDSLVEALAAWLPGRPAACDGRAGPARPGGSRGGSLPCQSRRQPHCARVDRAVAAGPAGGGRAGPRAPRAALAGRSRRPPLTGGVSGLAPAPALCWIARIDGRAGTLRIAMIGGGYVGLVSGACFADLGVDVAVVEVDPGQAAAL